MKDKIIQKDQGGEDNEKNIKEQEIDTIEIMARRYYRTWESADSKRQKGDRIYYKAGQGYYIVRPKKPRNWWAF